MGNFMNKRWKRITKLILMLVILNIATSTTQPVFAKDNNETSQEQLGSFKDNGKSYYHLDAVPEDFNEEKSFADNVTDKFWFLDMKDKAGQKMNEFFNYLVNIAFDMNILMTNFMISSLEFAYSFDFINLIIEKLDSIMKEITGITGIGNFSSSGIFGNLAKFVAVFTVIYAAFLMVWKRSMFSSLGTILQTILALTIALLLFSNYSTFLYGLNQITTQASSLVLAGGADEQGQNGSQKVETTTPTNLDEENLKFKMKDNLWTLFVDRPYLYMMYGETNLNSIGNNNSKGETINRINQILKNEPNSESRYNAISHEIDKGNDYLLYDSITKRISFTPMYLTINGITSLPVYFLALALLLFQFWFMLIAIFAPFALLFGAMPGQFNVVKRYFIELGLPLVLKIVVAFSALIIFAISELLYQADFTASQSNPFMGYIAAALIHFVLFMLIFFLRKRIKNIFVAGSQGVQEIRDGMGDFTNPLKKGTQGLATTSGAVVGGLTTGGAGALAGANIGSSLGKMTTGEGSIGDVAKSSMQAKRSSQLSSLESEEAKDFESTKVSTNQEKNGKTTNSNANSNTALEKLGKSNISHEKEILNEGSGQEGSISNLEANNNEKNPINEGAISPKTEQESKMSQGRVSQETYNRTAQENDETKETSSPDRDQSNTAQGINQSNHGQPYGSSEDATTEGDIAPRSMLYKESPDKDDMKTVTTSSESAQYGVYSANQQISKQDDLANLASLEEHIPPLKDESDNNYSDLD